MALRAATRIEYRLKGSVLHTNFYGAVITDEEDVEELKGEALKRDKLGTIHSR